MHRLHITVTAAAVSALSLSGCANDSAERQCHEAKLAYAQATEKFIEATHPTTKDAWIQTQLAARQWVDKVCPKASY